jgi:uncharacterized protein YozE (UPF0346 family)
MTTRYYVHGDKIENKDELYYCAHCDAFVSENHFSEKEHKRTDKERYDLSIQGWNRLKQNSKNYHRENNSPNLFSHLPNPRKPKNSSFYRWLKKQKHRDDSIGDLANDALNDKNFPQSTNSLQKMKLHLSAKFACSAAIESLEEAYTEFNLS